VGQNWTPMVGQFSMPINSFAHDQFLPVVESRFDFLNLFVAVPTPQNWEIRAVVKFYR
jgi:hypothetical protein